MQLLVCVKKGLKVKLKILIKLQNEKINIYKMDQR